MIVGDGWAEADLKGVRHVVPKPVEHVSEARARSIVVSIIVCKAPVILRINSCDEVFPQVSEDARHPSRPLISAKFILGCRGQAKTRPQRQEPFPSHRLGKRERHWDIQVGVVRHTLEVVNPLLGDGLVNLQPNSRAGDKAPLVIARSVYGDRNDGLKNDIAGSFRVPFVEIAVIDSQTELRKHQGEFSSRVGGLL